MLLSTYWKTRSLPSLRTPTLCAAPGSSFVHAKKSPEWQQPGDLGSARPDNHTTSRRCSGVSLGSNQWRLSTCFVTIGPWGVACGRRRRGAGLRSEWGAVPAKIICFSSFETGKIQLRAEISRQALGPNTELHLSLPPLFHFAPASFLLARLTKIKGTAYP